MHNQFIAAFAYQRAVIQSHTCPCCDLRARLEQNEDSQMHRVYEDGGDGPGLFSRCCSVYGRWKSADKLLWKWCCFSSPAHQISMVPNPDSEGCRPQTHKGLIPASVSDGLNRRDHFCSALGFHLLYLTLCCLKLCYSVFNLLWA